MVALGEVAEVNPRAPRIDIDDDVSFVGMAQLDVTAAQTDAGITRRFEEVSKGYTVFQNCDILVAKITPCFENNKIGQARLQHPVGAGSTEFHVVRPGELLDHRYVLHYLRQDHIRAQGELRMTGSAGQRRVPANYLEELQIPLPPLPEQHRIAAILDHADALRAKRRQVIAHLDDLAKSIFVEMFGDPIRNPHGYPLMPLGDVGMLDRGVSRHRPRNDPALLDGPYPLIQTGDVARSGGRITTYAATYSELGLRQSKLWPAGTLCITIAANIAETGILTFDACFPDSVVGFTADVATTSYVRIWLSFLQATLEAAAPQSAQRNINLAILRGLPVPLPDSSALRRFQAALDASEIHRDLVSAEANELDTLFASLQSRAFKGEL